MINKTIEKQEQFNETVELLIGLCEWIHNEYCDETDLDGKPYNEVIIDTLQPSLDKVDVISSMIESDEDKISYKELQFLLDRRQSLINSIINELARL